MRLMTEAETKAMLRSLPAEPTLHRPNSEIQLPAGRLEFALGGLEPALKASVSGEAPSARRDFKNGGMGARHGAAKIRRVVAGKDLPLNVPIDPTPCALNRIRSTRFRAPRPADRRRPGGCRKNCACRRNHSLAILNCRLLFIAGDAIKVRGPQRTDPARLECHRPGLRLVMANGRPA